MRELSDDDALWIGRGVPLMDSRNADTIALVRAGYRAAQAAMPPREPTQAMTEGPAADPIADLCERLRALHIIDDVGSDNPLGREAADALERQAREREHWQWEARRYAANADHWRQRAKRAEAERDTLRKCLKSVVSAWDDDYKPTWYERWQPAIDAARAKVKELDAMFEQFTTGAP